ncbi:MAG: nucleoside-diphosphate sugar epimerase/dehydratase, partial [Symbiobacteriia bacterium]
MAALVDLPAEAASLRVPRPLPGTVAFIFLCGDMIATVAAGLVSYWARTLFSPLPFDLYVRILPLLLFVPISLLSSGLYPGYGMGPVEQLQRSSRSISLVFIILLAFTYILKTGTMASRIVVFGWWLLSLLFVPLLRALSRRLLIGMSWWGKPLLVLGAARTGEAVVRRLLANPGLGLKPVACLDDDPAKLGRKCASVPVVGPLRLTPNLVRRHPISTVVVAMPGLGGERLTRVVEDQAALNILLVPDLVGLTSLWVHARDLQGVLSLELSQNLLSGWSRFLKRSLDLAVSIPGLVIVGPI